MPDADISSPGQGREIMKIYLVSAVKETHRMSAKFFGENFSDVEKQFTGVNPDFAITEIRLVGFIHDGVTYTYRIS